MVYNDFFRPRITVFYKIHQLHAAAVAGKALHGMHLELYLDNLIFAINCDIVFSLPSLNAPSQAAFPLIIYKYHGILWVIGQVP